MILVNEFMKAHYIRASVKQNEDRRGDIVLDVFFKKLSRKDRRLARNILRHKFSNYDASVVPDKVSIKTERNQNLRFRFVFRATLKSDIEFLSERFKVVDNHNMKISSGKPTLVPYISPIAA